MPSPLFLAVRAVVGGEDPVGLLAGGAPEDEYDPEVLDLLRHAGALAADDVVGVFVRWFGEEYVLPPDAAQRIADGVQEARSRLGA